MNPLRDMSYFVTQDGTGRRRIDLKQFQESEGQHKKVLLPNRNHTGILGKIAAVYSHSEVGDLKRKLFRHLSNGVSSSSPESGDQSTNELEFFTRRSYALMNWCKIISATTTATVVTADVQNWMEGNDEILKAKRQEPKRSSRRCVRAI